MEDAIAYARNLTASFEDAVTRFATLSRRWSETTTVTRSTWSDAAGREMFVRFLEPHYGLIADAEPLAAQTVEHQHAAIQGLTRAVDAARQSASEVAQSAASRERARAHAASTRQDVASVSGDVTRTRQMAQDVEARLSTLTE